VSLMDTITGAVRAAASTIGQAAYNAYDYAVGTVQVNRIVRRDTQPPPVLPAETRNVGGAVVHLPEREPVVREIWSDKRAPGRAPQRTRDREAI